MLPDFLAFFLSRAYTFRILSSPACGGKGGNRAVPLDEYLAAAYAAGPLVCRHWEIFS